MEEVEQGHLTKSQAKLKYGIQGDSTVTKWLRKYGNFDWENQAPKTMSKTPEQKTLELEAKVKLLEKQKARAEHLSERADKKVMIFDMLVDMAEKEYDIQIKKITNPSYQMLQRRTKRDHNLCL